MIRAVPLWSEALGLTGRADAIEVDRSGRVVPVEYKIGVRHGDAAHVQLCAQALCLEEMLAFPVERGAIWFSGPRRRVDVIFDAGLRARTRAVIESVHLLRSARRLPPAPADQRCEHCQLLATCLPSLVAAPEATTDYIDTLVVACDS